MKISAGPLAVAHPSWALESGTITAVVGDEVKPEVFVAQMLCGVAAAKAKVLVLASGDRRHDPVCQALVQFIGGGDKAVFAETMRELSLRTFGGGEGWSHVSEAHMVYASEVSVRELRSRTDGTRAPVVMIADGLADARHADEVIHVQRDVITTRTSNLRVPVSLDSDGTSFLLSI